jgi:C1A family cysteine protease
MNSITKKLLLGTAFVGVAAIFQACTEEQVEELKNSLGQSFGLNFVPTDTSNVESDLYLGAQGNGQIPSAYDLSGKFPPIGNQGQYGTCVAWAVAYNLKTYLEGVDKKMTSSQLAQPANQFSSKDLFLAIPTSKRGTGSDCNGTSFEAAFDMMVSRGVATKAAVPYENLNCASTAPNNVTTYKFKNYRKIKHTDKNELKRYLAGGRPIVFGAKLGKRFMEWNSNAVLTSDPEPWQGQHAAHAMVLVGYDDNKGANGAFKVINSWGSGWGAAGFIWVDYNFFVSNDFCFAAYVASNDNSNFNPSGGGGEANPNVLVDGNVDLVPWELKDQLRGTGNNRERKITYNVYNIGKDSILASKRWNIVYCVYNAYNANDFHILLYDYYTDEYGRLGDDGNMNTLSGNPHRPGLSGNWWNHVNVRGGKSVTGTDFPFEWSYTMPSNITGKYYLVLIADGYDVIKEYNEDNNYYFITGANNQPIDINAGVFASTGGREGGRKTRPTTGDTSPMPTLRNEQNVNTYTPEELKKVIQYQKESGILQQKINKYLATQSLNSSSKTKSNE